MAAGDLDTRSAAATFGRTAALQANGRILVAGQSTGANDFAIARLRG